MEGVEGEDPWGIAEPFDNWLAVSPSLFLKSKNKGEALATYNEDDWAPPDKKQKLSRSI